MLNGARRTGPLDTLLRAPTEIFFWLAAAALVAWLILSGSGLADGMVGPRASQTIFTILVSAVALSSGLILRREWRENPAQESEYGEWTTRQLFFSIVFAISFFVAFLACVGWLLSG